jgi:hypothetical protein
MEPFVLPGREASVMVTLGGSPFMVIHRVNHCAVLYGSRRGPDT